ncbi:MAG: winged helix-turn-helix domain-containing tetratricopeptide repeat protein [Pseudomonadales bacterium]
MADTDLPDKSIIYSFGDYQLDVARQELRHANETVPVQRKVLEILLFLVANRHRAVSKDELQDAIWPATIVSETSLTRAILKARRAINDDAQEQSLIKTLHGHGYRFVGEVMEEHRVGEAAEAVAVEDAVDDDHLPAVASPRGSFFAELKRRHVIRVGLLYIGIGWMLLQVADVLVSLLDLPSWSLRLAFLLLMLGLPIALMFAWVYELTPEGLKRDEELDRNRPDTPIGRRANVLIVVLLLVIGGQFAFQMLGDTPVDPGQAVAPQEVVPATPALAAAKKSIAVLPFLNMSSNQDNEYFADGLSEELLNLLAKTRDLQVAARTSAFSFKGKNADIRSVGVSLNVAHVLEGSVRWSGDRMRITAQLIEVETGYHLWSETYNRTLNDIFLVQDEIAAAVVDALKIRLLGGATPAAPKIATTVNADAYTLYLQGRHLYRQSTAESYTKAVAKLNQCLQLDPNYAPAWDTLGMVYTRQADHGILPVDAAYKKARAAVEKALAIDPNLAEAHSHLSWIAMNHGWNLAEADRHANRALALEPGSYAVLAQASTLAFILGRLDESIAMRVHALSRDPVSRGGHHNLATAHYYAGQPVQGETMYRKALGLSPGYLAGQFYLGLTLLAQDKSADALAAFEKEQDEGWRLEGLALAYHALGKPGEASVALEELHTKFASDMAYQIAEVHGYRGELDAAFDWLDRAYVQRDGGLLDMMNNPLLIKLHDDPRWQAMLRKVGLL